MATGPEAPRAPAFPILHVAGEALALRPERAAFLPARDTLLVADVHLGKARTFRRLGVPVPSGTTQHTLDRLSAAVAATRARRLVVLGDLLHSRHAQDSPAMDALRRWRQQHADLDVMLVRGNHDDHAGDPPPDLGIAIVDEPHPVAPGSGLLLCHDPHVNVRRLAPALVASLHDAGRPLLRVGGHLHPAVRVSGRVGDSVRLPAFHLGADFLVLPAFGEFTGMHGVRPREGERAWVVAEDRVLAVR